MRSSLRLRLLVPSLVLVAVALLIGALVLLSVLPMAVHRQLQTQARASATEVAALVDAGRVPDPLPVTGAQLLQVVGPDGTVRTGSATADRLMPLLSAEEIDDALAGRGVRVPASRAGQAGELVVVARRAGPRQDGLVVLAAVSTEGAFAGLHAARTGLLVALPALVAGLGLLLWRVVGSALAPVERLRSAAQRITGEVTDERLPEPGGDDEIAALAATLNEMLDRLARARQTQESFVADAAHELRSPIAALRTTTEVAARVDQDPLATELLGQVERLGALADDLLVLARAGNAPSRPPVRTDLAGTARQVAARYESARVPVTVTGDGAALVHPPDLERVLVNLLDNAVRHARTGVTVHLAGPVLTVEDDGPGIPADDRERVFDRFTRLQPARERDSGGSGLGLAIVRALLARGGGSIVLEPAAPDGTGVRAGVRLPAPP